MGWEGLNDLMWAKSLQGPLEGVGPEMATAQASAIWAKKPRFSGTTPSIGPSNGFGPIKIIKSKQLCREGYFLLPFNE